MTSERSGIKYPMWRKKVDGSMFSERCTVIPDWVKDGLFSIRNIFNYSERNNPKSIVTITLNHGNGKRTQHWGSVVTNERGKLPPIMRLFYGEDVVEWLQERFQATYNRNQLRKKMNWNGPTAEKNIPFWEFIDIEYNNRNFEFIFTAHYNLVNMNSNFEKI